MLVKALIYYALLNFNIPAVSRSLQKLFRKPLSDTFGVMPSSKRPLKMNLILTRSSPSRKQLSVPRYDLQQPSLFLDPIINVTSIMEKESFSLEIIIKRCCNQPNEYNKNE